MSDFIPHSDAEFNTWQAGVVSNSQANATAWGILAADMTALVASQGVWAAAYAKAVNPNNRLTADVQAKNDARTTYEKNLRHFIGKWLAKNEKVPSAERVRMGIPVYTDTHTAVPAPWSAPVAVVDFSTHLQHGINFVDSQTPTSKAKPEGAHGCEVWVKLGAPAPATNADYVYAGLATRTPFTLNFQEADEGKTAWYHLRWVNAKGEPGPWSSTVKAVVA